MLPVPQSISSVRDFRTPLYCTEGSVSKNTNTCTVTPLINCIDGWRIKLVVGIVLNVQF